MRDALVALGPQATSAEACSQWCGAICNLCLTTADVASLGSTPATRNNVHLLRVAAVRDAHAALEDLAATDADAKTFWDNASLALRDDEANA